MIITLVKYEWLCIEKGSNWKLIYTYHIVINTYKISVTRHVRCNLRYPGGRIVLGPCGRRIGRPWPQPNADLVLDPASRTVRVYGKNDTPPHPRIISCMLIFQTYWTSPFPIHRSMNLVNFLMPSAPVSWTTSEFLSRRMPLCTAQTRRASRPLGWSEYKCPDPNYLPPPFHRL